jgi:hypothetical protein
MLQHTVMHNGSRSISARGLPLLFLVRKITSAFSKFFYLGFRPCLVSIFLSFYYCSILFLFGNYCLITDYLGSKDSSRDLQTNCVINFYFQLYLMSHACAT